MKKVLGLASLVGLLVLSACGTDYVQVPGGKTSQPAPIKVMTFNVMCSFCIDREHDPWQQRLDYFRDIVARHDPDLIGIQELSPPPISVGNEVDSILERAPGWSAIYHVGGTTENDRPYPDATILYRTSRFTELEHGSYWLSPTPDEPWSTGFASVQFPRIVIWARLMDRERDREIFFASTHFDNNAPSQELSAPLVQERTRSFVDSGPVIFVGDFNSRPHSTAYGILTTDASRGFVFQNSFDLAPTHEIVTNQATPPFYDTSDRIDHIFLAGRGVTWKTLYWAADLTVYGPRDRYPSDHFPVVAEVTYE
jgi:endonuclease/exonuclease/phosphatase family metal-dependent hydrolase